MIFAAVYLLCMQQRVLFGQLSDFLKGLGHHLTDMKPVEILTLAPLGALTVVLGLFPGLVLDLIRLRSRHVLARRRIRRSRRPSGADGSAADDPADLIVTRPARRRRPGGARAIIVVDLVAPGDAGSRPGRQRSLGLVASPSAAFVVVGRRDAGHRRSAASYRVDALTTFLDLLFIAIVFLTILFAPGLPRAARAAAGRVRGHPRSSPSAGRCSSPASADLLVLFLGLELLVHPGLPAGGLRQARRALHRGRHQVLPAGLVLQRHLPLRPRLRAGAHRLDARSATSRRSSRQIVARPGSRCPPGWPWASAFADDRRRLQDRRRPVPLLDAGRLPGLADPGHRLPLGRARRSPPSR